MHDERVGGRDGAKVGSFLLIKALTNTPQRAHQTASKLANAGRSYVLYASHHAVFYPEPTGHCALRASHTADHSPFAPSTEWWVGWHTIARTPDGV